MQKNLSSYVLALTFLCFVAKESEAQIVVQPYSFSQSQKYSRILYNPNTRLHTSSKPMVMRDEDVLDEKEYLENEYNVRSSNWLVRKIFNEHLVQVEKEDHTFYLDFLPDFQIGKEMIGEDKRTTWLNTRGVQLGLTIKDKFTFYTNFFENQGVFPKYLDEYMIENTVPGQGAVENLANNKKDWMYASASLTYDFSPYFQVTMAYDKNHIGDGYRSVLLSDFSSNYTHLKFTGEIGNVQYTSIWAYMLDSKNPRYGEIDTTRIYGDGIKWGAFQYVDYNATDRFSIGFFQAVIWANRNPSGKRGFDFNYLNPAISLRPLESTNSSSPDKMFLGLNSKYKLTKNLTTYGQFMLGEFTAKEFFGNKGYIHNKWAAQIGVRGHDILQFKNLNMLLEYNLARPYMYQHKTSISNYSNHGEPLAHPRGANFRELVGILTYSWQRFDFFAEALYSKFGTDPADNTNYGGNIFQSYNTAPNTYGNKIGQGVKNNLYYADLRASYVFNPKYNLRFEIGYTQRYRQIEESPTQKSGVISFGLRSTFRNFYGDF